MRRAMRRLIGAFAAEIIECDDGAKAFDAYRKHLPDWVLMDIEMREAARRAGAFDFVAKENLLELHAIIAKS